MLYLGIDQHRKQLTVCLRDEQGDITLQRQVSTQWPRVRAFFDDLRQRAGEEGFAAIVEICGFNDWLLKMLAEYQCRKAVLVQPDKRSNRKTDRRDADALCQVLWTNRERLLAGKRCVGLRVVALPTADEAADRQLTEVRKRMGQNRTRTINKVKHLLRKHNLEQECPTKGIDTIAAKRWLKELALEAMDRLEMDLLLEQWDLCDKQIKTLDARIVERQRDNRTALVVATLPGCRAYSSLALASRIGSIDRFPRAASLANFWGLTPRCHISAENVRRGSITKQGSATARFILGQLVLHVLRRDPAMKEWYQRIKKRRGSKIARVAVMRRLATILWHMVKHHQAYRLNLRKNNDSAGAAP